MNAVSHPAPVHPDNFLPQTPSDRDQRIYFEVVICSRRQDDVAAQFELSQGRVSQIVKEVGAWRADATPMAGGALSGKRRQRLARSDTRQRLERLLEKTQDELAECGKPDVVSREGAWDSKEWHSTTTSRSRSTVQLLKLARNLALDLAGLDAEPPPPAEREATQFQAEMHKLIRLCMEDWKKQGKLPAELPPTAVNDVFKQMMHSALNYRPGTGPGDVLDAQIDQWDNYSEGIAKVCAAAEAAGCAGLDRAPGTESATGALKPASKTTAGRGQQGPIGHESAVEGAANMQASNISDRSAGSGSLLIATRPCQEGTCEQSLGKRKGPTLPAKKHQNISDGRRHSLEPVPLPVGVPNHPPDVEFEEYKEKVRRYYLEQAAVKRAAGSKAAGPPAQAGLP